MRIENGGRRWRRIGVTALVLGVVLCWYGWHLWETRFDVPVRMTVVQNDSVDDVPVETKLHEYLGRDSDTTTGRSIIFRFPKSYYGWAENARGGPQEWISLSIDRQSFQPLNVLEREIRNRVDLQGEQRKTAISGVRGNDLNVRVYSPTKALPPVIVATTIAKQYREDPEISIGTLCGWVVFVREPGRIVPPQKLPHRLTPEAAVADEKLGVVGLREDEVGSEHATAFTCLAHVSSCTLQTSYDDWKKMSFRLDRSNLCMWQQTAQLREFLDEHVVDVTPRRDSQTTQ
jgi:hypothetical protein